MDSPFCEKYPFFYEAFQHFFDGFLKSAGRLSCKKYIGMY